MADAKSKPETSDLIWGAENIAVYLNLDPERGERQVFHMVAQKQLPVTKVGNRLCASKSKLNAIAEGTK